MTTHDIRRAAFPCLLFLAAFASPAFAQPAPPPAPPGVLTVADSFKGIKKQLSFAFSGGYDLDVIGSYANGVLGRRDTTQVAIRQALPWPDAYEAIPKRTEFALGFGFAQKDEVVLRLSRAHYPASRAEDVGNYVDDVGEQVLSLDVSPYKELSWEIGLRHFMKMKRRSKLYVNLMYGNRIIEPLSAAFQLGNAGESIGTFRFYDKSTVKTFGLEMGLTIERGRAGVFTQVGARFVRRLKRNDEDVAAWEMQFVNNTGVRFYMPLQFGVLFRL
jgi:hypothetical protein